MKITELRIGNKVLYNGIECTVEAIGPEIEIYGQDFHYSAPIEQLMPVPITEKHLIELGFEKDLNIDYRWYHKEISLTYDLDDNYIKISDTWEFGKRKHLHKLQNLLCDLEQECE